VQTTTIMQNQGLQTKDNDISTAKQIDKAVNELLEKSKELGAFERALQKAEIISLISDALDKSDKMGHIMKMQGKQFGFKTDSRSPEGYSLEIVKNCLIEATIRGVEPTGNMFNILGGNCYITKEGCKHILNRMGIPFRIQPSLSKMIDGNVCVVPMNMIWVTKDNKEHKKYLEVPVTLHKNKEGGIITNEAARKGMAERDAMAYLIEELTGTPMPIGEVEQNTTIDTVATEIKSESLGQKQEQQKEIATANQKEQELFDKHIGKSVSKESLRKRAEQCYKQLNKSLEFYNLDLYNKLLETLPETA